MKNKHLHIACFFVFFILFFCAKKETKQSYLTFKINGFQKGKAYLLREDDNGQLLKIDSISIDKDKEHNLPLTLSEPELLYLAIDRNASHSNDNIIPFYAEPNSAIHLSSNLKNLSKDAVVTGSANHTKFEEHKQIVQKLNIEELKLTERAFKDTVNGKDIYTKIERIRFKKKLYSINFCFTNSSYHAATFIALNTFGFENPKLADSLYKKLTPSIQESRYGKKLKVFAKKQS